MRADVVALTMILAVEFSAAQNPHPQTVSVRQCRCKDIDGCSSKIFANVAQCKSNSQCVEFLKKIGDDAKIRTCLDAEQAEVAKMEECVRSKVGTVGCSKEANPGNLTIPLIPVMEAPEMYSSEGEATLAFQPPSPNGPSELGQYLMCVDQCSMVEESAQHRRFKRNPINCAFKLRCALAPPDEAVQNAFLDCQKQLGVDPQKRFKESCECLRDAGLSAMQC
ncbi:hypothetical protein L596_014904 [Steinernema carpocapsae]|uniref:Uncharacterized protein n=1 Tax=Steinernema carpocapsae TaxID=34508 RepID=A0A4U5NE96_STECR|nr:hypothetical protein L596_014904 [Steinernema carpocapsae]